VADEKLEYQRSHKLLSSHSHVSPATSLRWGTENSALRFLVCIFISYRRTSKLPKFSFFFSRTSMPLEPSPMAAEASTVQDEAEAEAHSSEPVIVATC
jgi:hypothetical protein